MLKTVKRLAAVCLAAGCRSPSGERCLTAAL